MKAGVHTGRQMFKQEKRNVRYADNADPVRDTVLSACHFFAAVSGASVCRECVLQKGRKMENRNLLITEQTTLGDLLKILDLGEKPGETPTPRVLRETAGEPIASEERCMIYRNGWAVYDNGSGCTVVWLPDCVSFTYQFEKPKKNEAWEVSAWEELPEGLLEAQPWPVAVTLLGDYSVERNLMKRKGSSCDPKSFVDPDCEYEITEEYMADPVLDRFFRKRGCVAEDPEATYIWKETLQEMLDNMTKGQRRVFVLYYLYGYKHWEIAKKYHVKRTAVTRILLRAVERAKEKI